MSSHFHDSIFREDKPKRKFTHSLHFSFLFLFNWRHWERPWCWEGLGAGGEGDDRGWDGWMASPTRWAWVCVNSGSWWWTGRPGMLQFMGLQRVRHNWATELNWTELNYFTILWWFLPYIDMNQPWVYMCPPSWNSTPTCLPIQSLRVGPIHRVWMPCFMHRNCTGDLFQIR